MKLSTIPVAAMSLCYVAPSFAHQELSYPLANTSVPEHIKRYAVTMFPDRIALLATQNPAHSQTIAWRTNASDQIAKVQITLAGHSPGLHLKAREINADYVELETLNGVAHHHRVTVDGLTPDTLYAYRVSGDGTWSEWFQFRTPVTSFAPYTALYFGDAQNSVLSHYSRTVREAFRTASDAKVMLYAGDLVNSRGGVHDDEWGEWFAATSWMAASINQLPAAGNHEFSSDDDNPIRYLLPNWVAHYPIAGNGPSELSNTVYRTDYQGVRYIALDSTEALQHEEAAIKQAEWLEQQLTDNPNQWTVVFHHHPLQSVSKGRDNPPLRKHWQPIYEKYEVDIVLQGHDHTYGRLSNKENDNGPVYAVSVAGPKMYLVSDEATELMQRTAEDTQLFQTLEFEETKLTYKAFTSTGQLYDAFVIEKHKQGKKSIKDLKPSTADHRCQNPQPIKSDRCWNGTEVIYAPVQN